MPFDVEKFEGSEFQPRTEVVRVDSLAEFFGEGEAPEWTVRGLNTNELNRADQAAKSTKQVESIVEAITDGGNQVQRIRDAIGLGKSTPPEVAKRLEMLVAGSVSPAVTMPIAARLAENFPLDFLVLTNAISRLCGLGAELKKPEAVSLPMAS